MKNAIVFLSAVGALLVGCGDSGGSSTSGSTGGEGGSDGAGAAGAMGGTGGAPIEPTTVAEFFQAKDVAFCTWSFGCCQGPPYGAELANVEACSSYESYSTEEVIAKVVAEIGAGDLLFDQKAAAECLTIMAELGCEANFWEARDATACGQVFESQTAVGEACTYGGCAPGGQCVLETSGASVCWPVVPLGANCQGDVSCGPDGSCDFNYTWICEAVLPNGSSCSSDNDCESRNCDGSLCAPRPLCQ